MLPSNSLSQRITSNSKTRTLRNCIRRTHFNAVVLQVLSLCSLILTTLGGPLLILGETAAGAAQYALAGAVVMFGISTTALLHMITSPYVLHLRKIADGSYEVKYVNDLFLGIAKNVDSCLDALSVLFWHERA